MWKLPWVVVSLAWLTGCMGETGDAIASIGSELSIDPTAIYTLSGVASGKCVQIADGSRSNSAAAVIQPCNGQGAQRFKLSAAGSGYYALRNVDSDKCLDVEARSTSDGARIIQYTCSGNTNQQWSVTDTSNGRVRLTARHSNRVAEPFGSNANGTALTQRSWANRTSQQFVLNVSGGSGSGGAGGTVAMAGTGGTVAVAGTGGVTGIGGGTAGTGGGAPGELSTRADVIAAMGRANDYFMAKWPDPGADIVTDKVRKSNIWTRAVYYEGLMALYAVNPQARLYDYAALWGQRHAFGLSGGATTRNADNQCAGQSYIDLYQIDARPERIRDIKTSIDAMVSSSSATDWTWIDAVQMSMPVFAKLGVAFNTDAYYEKMYALYNHTKNVEGGNGLYSDTDHLWWRDRDFDPPYREPNGKNCYWSRGNGWVYAALTRVLSTIPETAPHRAEYLQDFRAMSAALSPLQRSDGFWNVSLHDPNNFGGKELSGTALFTYGMAWGVRTGVLDAAMYRPIAVHAWNGMVRDALHDDGFLGYVQPTGKQPSDGQPLSYTKAPNFEDFGLGAFLLAGSEISKLASP